MEARTSRRIVEANLEACKSTRVAAARTMAHTLFSFMALERPASETELRDSWLARSRRDPNLFPDGWYMPPPHGMVVVLGAKGQDSRMNYQTLRPEEMWPKQSVTSGNGNDLGYMYFSPVNRETGMIGDLGASFYLGSDPEIREHLQLCLHVNEEIFRFVTVGITFSEVYGFAIETATRYGLTNEVTSTTDPAGKNIGHTIPASGQAWSQNELQVLSMGLEDWDKVKDMISSKRKFLSAVEEAAIHEGMAFTIEPRFKVIGKPEVPLASYHTIVLMHTDGTKEFLTNFGGVFDATGMIYMPTE